VRNVEVSKALYGRALGSIEFFVMAHFEGRDAYGFGRTRNKPDFWVEW
jgi:hypothetical protein